MLTKTISAADTEKLTKTVTEELRKGHGLVILPKGSTAVATAFQVSSLSGPDLFTETERALLGKRTARRKAAGRKESAIEQSAREFTQLVRESLTVAEAAKLLGVNPSRIRQRLGGDPRSLYGFKIDEEWLVPQFQFENGKLISRIEIVIRVLDPNLHALAVIRWFTTPNPDLTTGEDETILTPLDWLRTGNSSGAVARIASDL